MLATTVMTAGGQSARLGSRPAGQHESYQQARARPAAADTASHVSSRSGAAQTADTDTSGPGPTAAGRVTGRRNFKGQGRGQSGDFK